MENMENIKNIDNLQNTSGQGKNSYVPEDIAKNFNPGAFLLCGFWCLYHRAYIYAIIWFGLFFIPLLGQFIAFCLAIWIGFSGNKIAWQNRHWESIEEFNSIQRKWFYASLIVCFVLPFIVAGAFLIYFFYGLLNLSNNP